MYSNLLHYTMIYYNLLYYTIIYYLFPGLAAGQLRPALLAQGPPGARGVRGQPLAGQEVEPDAPGGPHRLQHGGPHRPLHRAGAVPRLRDGEVLRAFPPPR